MARVEQHPGHHAADEAGAPGDEQFHVVASLPGPPRTWPFGDHPKAVVDIVAHTAIIPISS
ncbi:hypothetical protein GCM10028790_46090 [Micromonospora taraxaci]